MLTNHNVFNRISKLEQFCRTIPGYPLSNEHLDTSQDNIPTSTPSIETNTNADINENDRIQLEATIPTQTDHSRTSIQTPLTLEDAITLAEGIDHDVTRLMIASKKKLKGRSPFPFSSTLAQCCLAVSILKLHRYSQKHNQDKTKPLVRLQSH